MGARRERAPRDGPAHPARRRDLRPITPDSEHRRNVQYERFAALARDPPCNHYAVAFTMRVSRMQSSTVDDGAWSVHRDDEHRPQVCGHGTWRFPQRESRVPISEARRRAQQGAILATRTGRGNVARLAANSETVGRRGQAPVRVYGGRPPKVSSTRGSATAPGAGARGTPKLTFAAECPGA